MKMEVRVERRSANITEVSPGKGIVKTPCSVIGFFQYMDSDSAYPVAVCELQDGQVITVPSDTVQFLKEDEV